MAISTNGFAAHLSFQHLRANLKLDALGILILFANSDRTDFVGAASEALVVFDHTSPRTLPKMIRYRVYAILQEYTHAQLMVPQSRGGRQ